MPFGEEARGWLLRYLAEARAAILGGQAQRRAVRHRAAAAGMTRQMFWLIVKKHARAAGIARAALAAHAAPRLRDAPAQPRRRPARGADAARPRRHLDDADLHPRRARAAEGCCTRRTTRAAEAQRRRRRRQRLKRRRRRPLSVHERHPRRRRRRRCPGRSSRRPPAPFAPPLARRRHGGRRRPDDAARPVDRRPPAAVDLPAQRPRWAAGGAAAQGMETSGSTSSRRKAARRCGCTACGWPQRRRRRAGAALPARRALGRARQRARACAACTSWAFRCWASTTAASAAARAALPVGSHGLRGRPRRLGLAGAQHPAARRYIFGHSLGGAIAVHLASEVDDAARPDRRGQLHRRSRDVVSHLPWGWLPVGPLHHAALRRRRAASRG